MDLLNFKNLWKFSIFVCIAKILISCFALKDFNAAEDWSIALNLLNHGTFSLYDSVAPTAMKTPVYPVFIYSIIAVFGASKLAVVIVQQLLSVITGLLLFRLARNYFTEKISTIIALAFLLHPSYFYYSNVIEVTNLFVPLAILSATLFTELIRSGADNSNRKWMLSSVVFALTILCQPIVTPIFFAAFIYLLYKKQYKRVAQFCAISCLVFSPWIIRNYAEFNKFIPTKTPFWMNIYLGYLDGSHGNSKYAVIPDSAFKHISMLSANGVNDVEMEKQYKATVTKLISANPQLYIEKTLWQGIIFWTYPPRYFSDGSKSFLLIRKIPVYLLDILLIVSLFYCYQNNKRLFAISIAVLLMFTLIYSLTSVANVRYKLDIEWLQLLLLGFVFQRLPNRLSKQ